MTLDCTWRGSCTSTELDVLHAEAFGTGLSTDAESDWQARLAAHSLGWVTARDHGALLGFVNVVWDGLVHAWLQDTMVATAARHRGVGTQLVALARHGAEDAGCEWLHVDFEERLAPFYLGACGFRPTSAGLLRL